MTKGEILAALGALAVAIGAVAAGIRNVGPLLLSLWKERQERARLLIHARQGTQPGVAIYSLEDPERNSVWGEFYAALKVEIRNDGRRSIGLTRPLRLVTARPRRGAPRGVDLETFGTYVEWPKSGYIAPATMVEAWCRREEWQKHRLVGEGECIGVAVRDLARRWYYQALPPDVRAWFNAR